MTQDDPAARPESSAATPSTRPSPSAGGARAEAFGGPHSVGPRAEPIDPNRSPASASSLRPLLLAGAAMIALTAVARVAGAPGWLAFGLGLAAFFGLLAWSRPGGAARQRRRVTPADGIDAVAVQAALDAAEAELAEIDRLAHAMRDRGLRAPLFEMTAAGRAVLEHIAGDPRDLRRARKFVKVYLPSARAAVAKFAGLGVVDAELSARFRGLVEEMTATGRRQLETLRLDEQTSLEIEMEVLAERLTAERPPSAAASPAAKG